MSTTHIDENEMNATREASGARRAAELNRTNGTTGTNGTGFAALEVSYQLIAALREVMPTITRNDRDLADQIQRAATSVSLNIAEGRGSMKGNRLKHYSLAQGSANEVKAGLFVAKAWGWIDDSETALAVLDRLLGLLWGLTRR